MILVVVYYVDVCVCLTANSLIKEVSITLISSYLAAGYVYRDNFGRMPTGSFLDTGGKQ